MKIISQVLLCGENEYKIVLYRAKGGKSTNNSFPPSKLYTPTHALFGMISVLHSLKSDTVFIHIFNTIYWIPVHRKSIMKWVHWVHFYLARWLFHLVMLFYPFYLLHLYYTCCQITKIWCIHPYKNYIIDYLLNFVCFVGLGDKQSWIVLVQY